MDGTLRDIAYNEYPARCTQIERAAKLALKNTFMFEAPWDMEQTHIPVTLAEPLDWQHCPADDAEWTFMLARQSFVLQLAQAYALTGNAAYAKKAEWFIEDFNLNAPLTEHSKQTCWRSLDAGIRITNQLSALEILEKSGYISDTLRGTLEKSAQVHLNYLLSVDTPFCRLSNWGVLGNVGLFAAAMFLNSLDTADEAVRRICDEIQLQILPDGRQWEQSPMYHAQVVLALLEMLRIAKHYGRELPPVIADAVLKMCTALANGAKPDHRQFMQSDSDDTDVRDVITQGTLALNSPVLKAHAFAHPCFESLFFITLDDTKRYEALSAAAPSYTPVYGDSGNCFLRTGFGEDESCVHFHGGTIGGGHGHADLLHVDLCAFGRDVLTDSGRYTYVENAARLWYKSCEAHNTFTVDGLPFTECTSSWGFGRTATPLLGACFTNGGYAMAEGGHLGYAFLQSPVICRRMVIELSKSAVFIFDICLTQGEHSYEHYFHFPEKDSLLLYDGHAEYIADGVSTAVLYLECGVKAYSTPISRHYNEQGEKSTLKLCRNERGTCVMPTAFISSIGRTQKAALTPLKVTNAKSGRALSPLDACAYRLTSEEDEWILIFSLKDTAGENDLLEAGGICGHGRVIIGQNGKATTLAW